MMMERLHRGRLESIVTAYHGVVEEKVPSVTVIFFSSFYSFLHEQRMKRITCSVCFAGKSLGAAGELQERKACIQD